MLACGRDALQFVDASDLRDNILERPFFPCEEEEFFQISRAVRHEFSLHDRGPWLHEDVSRWVDGVFGIALGHLTSVRSNGDDGFLAFLADVGNDAIHTCERCRNLRHTRLEDLFDTRESHSDVAA